MKPVKIYDHIHLDAKIISIRQGRTLEGFVSSSVAYVIREIKAGRLSTGKLEKADHKRNQAKPEPK